MVFHSQKWTGCTGDVKVKQTESRVIHHGWNYFFSVKLLTLSHHRKHIPVLFVGWMCLPWKHCISIMKPRQPGNMSQLFQVRWNNYVYELHKLNKSSKTSQILMKNTYKKNSREKKNHVKAGCFISISRTTQCSFTISCRAPLIVVIVWFLVICKRWKWFHNYLKFHNVQINSGLEQRTLKSTSKEQSGTQNVSVRVLRHPKLSSFTHSQVSAVVPVWYWVAHGTASSLTPTAWGKREIEMLCKLSQMMKNIIG